MGGCLSAENSSQVTMSGGSIGERLSACNQGQITMFGGSVSQELRVSDSSTLTIHGSDFAVDGQPFGYGELISIVGSNYSFEPCRYLTGILASGDLLNNDFRIGNNGKIVLVPEPASAVMLGLGSLFLALRRRRQ